MSAGALRHVFGMRKRGRGRSRKDTRTRRRLRQPSRGKVGRSELLGGSPILMRKEMCDTFHEANGYFNEARKSVSALGEGTQDGGTEKQQLLSFSATRFRMGSWRAPTNRRSMP